MAALQASSAEFETKSPAAAQGTSWRLVLLVFLVALGVRSVHLTRPLLGNFATKNAAYGMIARNFARGNAPVWRPTLDVMVNGQRGAHLLEVPLSAYAAGLGWKICGGSLDTWGRAVSAILSALTAALLTVLGGRWFGTRVGLAAGLALAFAPVSIIYGQSFMLEASVAFFVVAAMLSLDVWASQQRRFFWLVVCGLSLAALFLTKIFMLVILWPIVGLGMFRRSKRAVSSTPVGDQRYREDHKAGRIALSVVLLLACLPALAWVGYVFTTSDPDVESVPVFYSLRNSATAHAWPPPILRSPEFYQQFLDDLMSVFITPIGFVLALLGIANRSWFCLIPWLGSCVALVLALPLKFHEMNYYWVPLLPPVCLLIGVGWRNLTENLRFRGGWWRTLFLGVVVILTARYSLRPAFVTPAEDRSVVAAAEAAQEFTSEDDLVVTIHGTSIDLLYYCDRRGWALSVNDPKLGERISELANAGARVLVVANKDAVPASVRREWESSYTVLREGTEFIVFRLPAQNQAK
ncbi:MAG: glycosyltransferase family 39 protein [Pirellulales bacterium]|nr:glycosyltransferase family 39 protein [Pirellulales bacterium]